MASSLKSKFVVPALLAGAAVLTGCNDKNPRDDLEGMVNATATACPTENKDVYSRKECTSVGVKQAKKLFEYSGIGAQFEKSCTFKTLPDVTPPVAVVSILGPKALKCLKAVEENTTDDVVKQVARDVRETMKQGL